MSLRIHGLLVLALGCSGGEDEENPQSHPIGEESDADSDADADADTAAPTGLEIVGDWSDIYGLRYEITETLWTTVVEGFDDPTYAIRSYDNTLDSLVAQNGADNANFPGLYSRIEWLAEGEGYWYCHSTLEAATEAEAAAVPAADRSDPATSGCVGGAWIFLSPD